MKEKKGNVSLKSTFKTIIWPRKKLIFCGLIMISISRLAGLVIPEASKYLIDEVIAENDIEGLKTLLIVVFASILLQSILSFALTRLLSVEAQLLISKLRVKIQKKILALPIAFFDNNKAGNVVSRIMYDVEGVKNLIGTGFVQLIGGLITALVSLVLLFKINVVMTLSVLLPVILFALIGLKALGYIRPIFKKRGEINAEVTGRLTETINGIRVIKGFNSEAKENSIFKKNIITLFNNIKKSITYTAILSSSSTFIIGLTSVIIMGIGGINILNNEITFGEFLSFTIYLGFLISPIMQMSDIGSQITESLAGLDRIQELMDLENEEELENRTLTLNEVKGNITFKNVSYAYEEEKMVLHNINFEATEGTITALVGTSGSGKTTIAGLAATFLNPKSGLITIDGVDLSKVKLDSYRQQLGLVLQDNFLFEGTIRENITFPKPNYTEKELENAINAAHVKEFVDHFEDGLETIIGERGVKLSGGQRQRISIARAILVDPKIIILDEATSNLDTQSELLIQKSLSKLMKGRTAFVIAHRLSTIKKADQIIVIEKGKIIEIGNHEELIHKKGQYYNLYNVQARI